MDPFICIIVDLCSFLLYLLLQDVKNNDYFERVAEAATEEETSNRCYWENDMRVNRIAKSDLTRIFFC